MTETLIAILGIAGTVLAGTISFVLGQRWERRRQSLIIRSQMLTPVEEWLRGVERMIGILGDTMTSVISQSPLPVTYSLEERRKTAQFMIEKTNIVVGILQSNSLRVGQTKKLSEQLANTIATLDNQIKYELLPLDDEILGRSLAKALTRDFLVKVGEVKLKLDSNVQRAYSLIAQLKTALT